MRCGIVRSVWLTTVGSLLSIGLLAGCANESPMGGPGATAKKDADRQDERTFKLEAPVTRTNVEQGERQEVTLSIDREDHFNQTVNLEFKTPEGVKVTPSAKELKPNDKEIQVTIEALPDAKVGEASIDVIGTPESGVATRVAILIDVKPTDGDSATARRPNTVR